MTDCHAHRPLMLFRFAIRERDWPLAAALAEALRGSPAAHARIERELEQADPASSPPPSMSALRALAALLKTLRPGRGSN